MRTDTIVIRDLESVADLERVAAVERAVWGLEDRDVLPLTMLVATRAAGAVVVGAFDGDALVGFVYGVVGLEHGETTHHSHMLAVLPPYRSLDLGRRLKLAQRERVLAQGIRRVTWTYDPLQSRNAHFNFTRLGVVADSYRVNFYGEETSSFLHKLGTDRFWVTWELDSARVRERAAGLDDPDAGWETAFEGVRLVRAGLDEEPRTDPSGLAGDVVVVEIPGDINALQSRDYERAFRWRIATRAALTDAIGRGYVADAFARVRRDGATVGAYRLKRP
jgi:predicted GNAT superfamily acetyltransferase